MKSFYFNEWISDLKNIKILGFAISISVVFEIIFNSFTELDLKKSV